MENKRFCTLKTEQAAELEHIEYLLTGGRQPEEVMTMFPQYSKETIAGIVRNVSQFCWLSSDEANTRTINGKEYIVKSVFSDNGIDIKSAILKLAERKTLREMGIDIPLDFERNNPF